MSSTIHGRGAGAARPSSIWSLAIATVLALGGSSGCAGIAPMEQRSQEVPILEAFQIRTVQRELRLRGFRVEPTGVWDETTRAALASYQRSRGLPPTGEPDLATLWKLGVDPDPMYNCEINNTVDCSPSTY